MLSEVLLFVWIVSNFLTGVSYFHIPLELWCWTRGQNLRGLRWVSWLFKSFILLCGTHHLNMLRYYKHHPIDLPLVAGDAAMAFVSVLVSGVLIAFRGQIRGILTRLT